ncbi:MAG: PAS domain-containing protein, partial [Chromatiaceae bacterium]|nr:PAS domain-containing protein [Chromatiaceae bacterium]
METRPDRGAKRGSAGDASQRHKRLELLETIADHLGVGALLLGPDGDLDIQTRQAERFAAILGKGWYRHCMRQDLKEQVLNVEDERQKGYSFEISRLSLYREDDVLLIRNITESVPKESERDCRRLFEQCPVGQAIHRLNGDLVECNNAYAEIFGRTPEEMLGLSYGDLTPKEYLEGDQRQLEKLRNTGRYGPVEKELLHKKGYRVAVRLRGKL